MLFLTLAQCIVSGLAYDVFIPVSIMEIEVEFAQANLCANSVDVGPFNCPQALLISNHFWIRLPLSIDHYHWHRFHHILTLTTIIRSINIRLISNQSFHLKGTSITCIHIWPIIDQMVMWERTEGLIGIPIFNKYCFVPNN